MISGNAVKHVIDLKKISVQLKAKSVHLRCCTTTAHAAHWSLPRYPL